MSSQSVKSRMSGFLRKVFGKGGDAQPEAQPAQAAAPAPVTAAAPKAAAPLPGAAPVHRNGGSPTSKGLELPLQSILAGLPLELQPKLKHSFSSAVSIAIPLEKILSQLSRGVVKISFGELRQAAPELFTPETDRDRVSVTLPLGEILPRLNPALITRRREQKIVEISPEISSPFDTQGRGLVFSAPAAKPESAPAASPAARQVTPGPSAQPAAAPGAPVPPAAPATRNTITFTPTPAPPAAIPLSTPAVSSTSRTMRELGANNGNNGHSTLQPQAPIPMSSTSAPAPALAPQAPIAMPPAPAPVVESAPLVIGLSVIAEGWPDAVRKEILQLHLTDAKAELPCEVIEKALRQGKIAFPWKTLRSWLKPAPASGPSAQDNTALELPLKIVAPLFLARQHELNKSKRKVTVDDDIPNLFFGFPQAESGNARVASPAKPASAATQDTNYYVWEDGKDRLQPVEEEAKGRPSPGTKFVAKYATPNEVVSRASSLDGVVGALIALPDGLMVASKLAPDLNGDTLAAFLPQIFGKVNQCTKELRMGELNNLNFTVGNVPWKIFRVNAIFFAAFGRAGEPLPTAQLAALAAELDHKPK